MVEESSLSRLRGASLVSRVDKNERPGAVKKEDGADLTELRVQQQERWF